MLHIHDYNTTEENTNLKRNKLQPLFNYAEVDLTGNPTLVDSPVGNGIQFTNDDHIGYKFNVSEPWPCPFDINQCFAGFTMSVWFKWEYVVSSYYRYYITLGDTFKVYRASDTTQSVISLRWNVDGQFTWFCGSEGNPGKWNLITWKINHTQTVCYLNGLKDYEKVKEMRDYPSYISNEIHFNKNLNAGNFSVGPLQLWAGGKSPVFILRLFKEGLTEHDDNWHSFITLPLFLDSNFGCCNELCICTDLNWPHNPVQTMFKIMFALLA